MAVSNKQGEIEVSPNRQKKQMKAATSDQHIASAFTTFGTAGVHFPIDRQSTNLTTQKRKTGT